MLSALTWKRLATMRADPDTAFLTVIFYNNASGQPQMSTAGVPRVGAFQRHGTVCSHTQHFKTVVDTKPERAIDDGLGSELWSFWLRIENDCSHSNLISEDVTTGLEQN